MTEEHTEFARHLRRNQTDAEKLLWFRLRHRQVSGMKFRRQVPLFGFYVDFLCEDAKVIVELDGGQHGERELQDTQRTHLLQQAGFVVLRFWNNDVLSNTEGVLIKIAEVTQRLTPHPVPLPAGGGR